MARSVRTVNSPLEQTKSARATKETRRDAAIGSRRQSIKRSLRHFESDDDDDDDEDENEDEDEDEDVTSP